MKKTIRNAMRVLYLIICNGEQLYNSLYKEGDDDSNIRIAFPKDQETHKVTSRSKLIPSSECA